MDAETARTLAQEIHAGQVDRLGEPVIDHVERVARAVPEHARALAYLHDALERSATAGDRLRQSGLTRSEYAVLDLLTRRAAESYETYVMRIARGRGSAARTARLIKVADLDDHLRQASAALAPNYAWARRQMPDGNDQTWIDPERRARTTGRPAWRLGTRPE